MRSVWRSSVVMLALCGIVVVYLHHVEADLTRELRALAKAVETRDTMANRTPMPVSTFVSAAVLEEAARRGAAAALSARDGAVAPCPPAGAEDEPSVAVRPSPTPSPEALRAFDESGAIIAAGLSRKVWTEQDRLDLEARLPFLDAPLRDEMVRRVLEAVNAGLLNLAATHGQVF